PVLESSLTYDLRPPGLILLEDFVTEQEEESLLNCVDWSHTEHKLGQSLKLRKVKHFGYEFHYDINNVHKDSPLTQNIPEECSILLPRLKERNCNVMSLPPDQLTVNQYQPGQGIPSHVDTHSAFEDPILSLSLGTPVVMEFKYQDGQNVPVYLPQRSLLVMSGESRYLWSHGISPRKTDIVPTPCGTLNSS
ncbi:unnamed protein product, partial [Timema podura]|nr:unnamed protein product [Timema podura]